MTAGSSTLNEAALMRMEKRLKPLREQLASRPLYKAVQSVQDLQILMESHVFAVWDFMSLLKGLQRALTCIDMPWTPRGHRNTRRLINEIVLGEESDFVGGENISHLELYLEAMKAAGANVQPLEKLLAILAKSPGDISDATIQAACSAAGVPRAAAVFVRQTFSFLQAGRPHVIAAAFAFGREDLIPLMFTGLLKEMNRGLGGALDLFIVYLERHIEVDGDEHGPMSMQMISELCGGGAGADEIEGAEERKRWEEATETAETALRARIQLWDGVCQLIEDSRTLN